jgi:hypothetical protein
MDKMSNAITSTASLAKKLLFGATVLKSMV